jgi:transcriptional regulator PpsR
MSEPAQFSPDITLAVDGDGVIQTAVSAEALADEPLEEWRGLRWSDTVPAEVAERVARAVESVRNEGASSCFTVTQRLPSGRELMLEYTAVRLGKKAGFLAIGRSVQAIADLKSRLASVQKEREQDYWKLREIETRYKALLDASSEAVVLVRVDNLRVVEANAAAAKSLGLVPGVVFPPQLTERDRRPLDALLETARLKGRAPGIVIHLVDRGSWSLRASTLTTEAGTFYLFQMAPLPEADLASAIEPKEEAFSLENFVWRMPEAFAVVDRDGVVRYANMTFLDLVQSGAAGAVIGRNAKHWFTRPGMGMRVILNLVERHGVVRSLKTELEGELGMSAEVEVSAVGDEVDRPRYFGLLIRDLTSQANLAAEDSTALKPSGRFAGISLEAAVRSSIEVVERERLIDALAESNGNRAAAAKSLGISRQSLYTKLKKYTLQQS